MNGMYKNTTTDIILNVEDNAFPPKLGKSKNVCSHHLFATLY